jgi:signal recognition particle GTPase
VDEVNRLLKQFDQIQKLMKQFSGGGKKGRFGKMKIPF